MEILDRPLCKCGAPSIVTVHVALDIKGVGMRPAPVKKGVSLPPAYMLASCARCLRQYLGAFVPGLPEGNQKKIFSELDLALEADELPHFVEKLTAFLTREATAEERRSSFHVVRGQTT